MNAATRPWWATPPAEYKPHVLAEAETDTGSSWSVIRTEIDGTPLLNVRVDAEFDLTGPADRAHLADISAAIRHALGALNLR